MARKKKAEQVEIAPIDEFHYFATPVYITKQPQFLDVVKTVSADSIKQVHGKRKPNKIHPVLMSGNLLDDARIEPFAQFVGSTAWNILASQGFAMDGFQAIFTEMWCQEHYQTSSMEYHNHPGSFIVGFYFIDVPDGAPRAIIHDPRHARLMMNLPETDPNQATLASTMINFQPEAGMMMFAPSWLAHSFGRNASKEPFKFVHFNIAVQAIAPQISFEGAEVI